MTDEPVELVDIVDDDDCVVGTVTRAEMRARRLRHRAVAVVVVDAVGRVLVHRRSDDKDVWPGRWDLAAGGVVAAGESYVEAAHRELAEELGFEVEADAMTFVTAGRYVDDDVDEVAQVFRVEHPGPFHFADGEITEARFVAAAELAALVAAESFVPDSLALIADPLFGLDAS